MATYRHGLVSFIDLLGFGAIVDAGASPDTILRMLESVKRSSHVSVDTKRAIDLEYLCISDCLIRSLHLEHPEKTTAPELQQELLDLVHIQFELLAYGLPIRGAVVHGDVYFRGRTIFG